MPVTTFQEKLASAGATLGSYRGAETGSSFGDGARELRALVEGCAIFDMSWQAKLVLTGEDRVRWLNGMVTNNVRDLGVNRGVYNFVLNPQGRNLGDLMAYHRGDYLLVTTDREQAPRFKEIFDRYIIMDDVEVAEISDELATVGVAGPQAAETLRTAGIDVAGMQAGEVKDLVWRELGISVARSAIPQMDGYELWFATANIDQAWEALVGAGATPVGTAALEMYRILRGVPRYGVDLRERDLPQETGQQHALNFSKGCYVGQEIVERIRARGNVHRAFLGFEVEGDAPEPGAKVLAGGKEAGEITSAARVPQPDGERTLALGYLRREFVDAELKVGEQKAAVRAFS